MDCAELLKFRLLATESMSERDWTFNLDISKGCSKQVCGDTEAHIRHKMAVLRSVPAGLLSHMQMKLSQ